MLFTIAVQTLQHIEDSLGQTLCQKINALFKAQFVKAQVVPVFIIEGLTHEQLAWVVKNNVLHDPVLQKASLEPVFSDAEYILEVGFLPGVTDTTGRTAKEVLQLALGVSNSVTVYSAMQYHFWGTCSKTDMEEISTTLLSNKLIQRASLKDKTEWQKTPGFLPVAAKVGGIHTDDVATIAFSTMDDEALMAFSRENTLALSLEELHTIKAYFSSSKAQAERKKIGLGIDPTDAEIEALAQTWSEHCKHKIFSAGIQYENTETGHKQYIDSLYKTCIQGSTKKIRERLGHKDFCRSVFKDNAGVVAFTDTHDVCIKVETHNSPSALDPYGGAMTGVIGVNRDAIGTGMGSEVICNTDVLCCGSPFYDKPLPPRLLHPRRILDGVREGVEHGANRSGSPVVNGSFVFDERFLGKPLVYCGSVGLLPATLHGRPGHYKKACVGDVIVMIGGRIGKDGIHGATFSSEELHKDSPATAVQIGDPILQRNAYDCIIKARNLGLYSTITDNGAGGLSSSVGETAENTGGCLLDLAQAPLKYASIRPWEILISEAQERMTLAVPPQHLDAFMQIADEMHVEATALGTFTDSGFFHVVYGEKNVAYLPMSFLHNGVPQMQLSAVWERPKDYPIHTEHVYFIDGNPLFLEQAVKEKKIKQTDLLLSMLSRLNICSKESIIRQFDHEVQGHSAVKPLVGVCQDGPADAAVLRPLLASEEGIVLSHGICPKFSDADTYWMMANAIDEAVRNAVAVGADPEQLAGVDNFCWCDPVQSEKTPDGTYKLAQLVRANKALEHFCLGFGVPCVSGKDSMKNDYTGGGEKISIPPTVLFSILGKINNVNKAVTSDFKQAGDAIYLLGITKNELAGSEIVQELELLGGAVPEVDLLLAKERYTLVHKAMQQGLINACHDLSDGGFAVALAEMCIGGRLGARVNMLTLPALNVPDVTTLLYSESASRLLVTVPRENISAFQKLCEGHLGFDMALIGNVAQMDSLVFAKNDQKLMELLITDLVSAFTQTLL